jgi:acetyl-CoA carboxylase carboxyl transferase subunit alpha
MQEDNDYLDFEKPIAELESKITGVRRLSYDEGINIASEVARLEKKLAKEIERIYEKLTPWQVVQVARHPKRPHALDYIGKLVTEFTPLAGDRLFGNDEAIVAGLGRFNGRPVAVMGQEKGHDLETRMKHKFGSPYPEGYRKACRMMELADKFNLPLISFIDTAGAFPGIEAEERGQAEAIARAMEKSTTIGSPFVAVVIGEGGSGGAIAVATANRVLMLQNAIYAVISPEGGASILWKSGKEAQHAAEAFKMTAADLQSFGVIDEIIPEPMGGAHRDPETVIRATGEAIERHLQTLETMEPEALITQRRERFMSIKP